MSITTTSKVSFFEAKRDYGTCNRTLDKKVASTVDKVKNVFSKSQFERIKEYTDNKTIEKSNGYNT